jgi:hypothetical protein
LTCREVTQHEAIAEQSIDMPRAVQQIARIVTTQPAHECGRCGWDVNVRLGPCLETAQTGYFSPEFEGQRLSEAYNDFHTVDDIRETL